MTLDWNHTQYLYSWRKTKSKKPSTLENKQAQKWIPAVFRIDFVLDFVFSLIVLAKLLIFSAVTAVLALVSTFSQLSYFVAWRQNALLLWNHDLVKHVYGEYHTPNKTCRKMGFFSWRVFLFIYFLQCPKLMSKTQSSCNKFLINCLFEGA